MNAFILAAGEGTRFRPHTLVLPKPALPILNIPLMSFPYAYLAEAISDKNPLHTLAINTFHLPEKIHKMVQTLPRLSDHLCFSNEVGQILGSGGGLAKCKDLFSKNPDDIIVMINGDEVFLPQSRDFLKKAIDQHRSTGALATLIVTQHPGVGKEFGGVWTDSRLKVMGFGKTPPSGNISAGWHFIGIQILSPKVFQFLKQDSPSNILYDGLVDGLKSGSEVRVFPSEGLWFETGNLTDYLHAHSALLNILLNESQTQPRSFLQYTLREIGKLDYSLSKLDQGVVFTGHRPVANSHLNPKPEFSKLPHDTLISKLKAVTGFLVMDSGLVLPNESVFENTVIAASCSHPPQFGKNQLYLE